MGFGKSAKRTYFKLKKKAYGSKGVKGRYIRPGAVTGLQNLAKDVAMIKSRLNVEKKQKLRDVITQNFGQVNANADGALAMDVTPIISQGTGGDARVGNSLKLTGLTFPMSMTQMTNNRGDRQIRVTLLRVKAADNGVTAAEAFEQVWDANPLTTVRDFNAPRAFRNSSNDGIAVIRFKTYYLKAPSVIQGTGDTDTERMVKSCRFSVKLDDILRYESGSDTYPQGIRYVLVFQCNAGNSGSTSSLDVPIQNGSTGVALRLGQRSWWVDN